MNLKPAFFGQILTLFILATLFSVWQYGWLPLLLPSWTIPDLIFGVFLYLASARGFVGAVLAGFVLGSWAGAQSGIGAPFVAVNWILVGAVVSFVSKGVEWRIGLTSSIYTGVVYFLSRVLGMVFFGMLQMNTEDRWWRLLMFLPLSLSIALIAPFLFKIISVLPFMKEDESIEKSMLNLWRGRT